MQTVDDIRPSSGIAVGLLAGTFHQICPLTTKLRIYCRKHENVLRIIGINVGSARSGIYSVVRPCVKLSS